MPQQFNDFLAPAGAAPAGPSKGLAQRAGGNIDALYTTAMFVSASAAAPDITDGMTVVKMYQRIVALGETANLAQPGEVAVHRKNTVGGDQLETGPRL